MKSKILVSALALWIGSAALLSAQPTTRVSIDSQGREADLGGASGRFSADMRFVVFVSDATNLVLGDTNGCSDVFVHDQQTGETTRVSVSSQGNQANGPSGWSWRGPSISGDGRYVAFSSDATNLVPGDTNAADDVFVHDRQTGETTRVTVTSQGSEIPYLEVFDFAIAAGGRFVTFDTDAAGLVPGNTNDHGDVFVHDLQTGETTLVSKSSNGEQGNHYSWFPAISADGRFVAFESDADNLVPGDTNGARDAFVHDRLTGETTRVSVNSLGQQTQGGDSWGGGEYLCTISPDGRFVAFTCRGGDLVPGDTNQVQDTFLHDRQTGETARVSVSTLGTEANGRSWGCALSADGRFVAFDSEATNLVPGDTNELRDVFVHDRQTGETDRVSLDYQGREGQSWNRMSLIDDISNDGQLVLFTSGLKLVPDDTNSSADVFMHGRDSGPCLFPASSSSYDWGWPGTNGVPGFIAVSNPSLCTTVTLSVDNSLGADTSAVLFVGMEKASLLTQWQGILRVLPVLASPMVLPAGGLTLAVPVPCEDALCGLSIYAQVLERDPGASRGVSFTAGLELRLGAP